MEYAELLDYFGSVGAIARALKVAPPSVHGWKARGIPPLRQVQIEHMTIGKLKAAHDVYEQPTKRGKALSA